MPGNPGALMVIPNAGGGLHSSARSFPLPNFDLPLLSTVVPLRGVGSATYTRATVATVTDFEGKVRNCLSGEVRFTGARRVHNLLISKSEDFSNAAWAKTTCTITAGVADPAGGTGAYTATATAANAVLSSAGAAAIGDVITSSIWIRRRTGTGAVTFRAGIVTGIDITSMLTTSWRRFSGTSTLVDANARCALVLATNGDAVDVYQGQVENVTGQSNQNPSEYVSAGVLSSPFHGAMVDGVKYFDTENGNTVTSNVVTEATGRYIGTSRNQSAWLPGLSGSYFSTPDSVANSITGDIDIRVKVAMADWTPAAASILVSKDDASVKRCYDFLVASNGTFQLITTADGNTARTAGSSTASGITDGTTKWVRATRAAATGTTTFYLSDDGVAWTQLGTTVATTAGAIFDGDNAVEVGSRAGGALPAQGTIYRAQIYNGIDGTLAVDFNPQDHVTGGTFVSSGTGETWTLNGGAAIRNFPMLGYLAEQASTNLVLQSENFGTTWAALGTPTRVAAAKRCGSVVLDLIGDDAAGALENYSQSITFTGDAVKAVSLYVAQGSAVSTTVVLRDNTAVSSRLRFTITWTNGAPSMSMNVGTLLETTALADGVFRLGFQSLTITSANANAIEINPGSDNTLAVAGTGTIYIGGVQVENSTICTSYQPTTTAAVTRNADVLTYPVAGNVVVGQGTLYCEAVASSNGTFVPLSVNDGTTNNRASLTCSLAAGHGRVTVSSGGVTQADIALGSGGNGAGTVSKLSCAWQTNRANVSGNGVVGTADTSVVVPASFTQIEIGMQAGTQAKSPVRNVKLWLTPASDGILQRMTA